MKYAKSKNQRVRWKCERDNNLSQIKHRKLYLKNKNMQIKK